LVNDKHREALDMKRFVFGMVAVLCLQFGFIAFTAWDRSTESLVAQIDVASGADPIDLADEVSNGPEFADADYPGGPIADRREVSVVSTVGGRKIRRSPGPDLAASNSVRKGPASIMVNWEPVIVLIPKPSETKLSNGFLPVAQKGAAPRESQAAPKDVRRSERRSFFSKSVSVIKMPYRWMKALGSRIM
jgi:hypothetical protein